MEATLDTPTFARGSTAARWSGRVLTGIPVAFMLFDATVKFAHIPEVAEASLKLGWPTHLNPVLGVIILGCLALYLWPRTAVLGVTLGSLFGLIAYGFQSAHHRGWDRCNNGREAVPGILPRRV